MKAEALFDAVSPDDARLKPLDSGPKERLEQHDDPPEPAQCHPVKVDPLSTQPTRDRGLSLSALLRGLGGFVIVAAFLMYLFRGWRDGDDLTRCILLIAHTGVLTLAGFALGHLVHEAKGARLFIALALAAVPVNFAFLGSITYDHLTWDGRQVVSTALTSWLPATTGSLTAEQAMLLAGGALVILALAIWIGFLVMARRSAVPLTGLYLLANGALLVPTRDGTTVSALLLALAVLLTWLRVRLRRHDPSLATPEGVYARGILALPLLILVGRSLWLYAPDELFFLSLCLAGYLGLRQAAGAGVADSRGAWLIEPAAVLLASSSGLLVFAAVVDLGSIAEALKLPLAGAVFAGLMIDLSTRSLRRGGLYRGLAAGVGALIMVLNLFIVTSFAAALASLAVGIATLTYGYAARSRLVFALGMIAALAGLGVAVQKALATFTIGGWSGLVLLGVVTIVAGSMLERHGDALKAALGRWHHHFDTGL